MFVKFFVFSTIFTSALAQANDYFYIRNVVSQSVLDVYQGTRAVDASVIANVLGNSTANPDSQLWTFEGNSLVNKFSALYLTVQGSPEVGSNVILDNLSSQVSSDKVQSWTMDPVKKRLVPGDSSLCLTISREETAEDPLLPLVGLSQIDYTDVTQQWEFIPGPGEK